MSAPTTRIVVTDASVLINLIHVGRLRLCADLPHLRFTVPDHVRQEIRRSGQRAELDRALKAKLFDTASITDPVGLSKFAALTARLGRGETACLVLAEMNGWTVASDEKGRFRREAVGRIGKNRILGTVDIFLRAIQANLITVDEADADKAKLETNRFKMPFHSFREKLSPSSATR